MRTRTPKKNKSDILKTYLQSETDLTSKINEAIFNKFFDILEKNISDHIKLKKMNVEVEIDGGINFETGKTCVEAGADILVAGSFLFNQGDLISSTNKMSDNFN